jgi:mannose/fructose/N-acetylgalactosamine-specific phosphotransferase system component IIB
MSVAKSQVFDCIKYYNISTIKNNKDPKMSFSTGKKSMSKAVSIRSEEAQVAKNLANNLNLKLILR